MLPTPARNYLLVALENTPVTASALLAHLPSDNAAWNLQPEPDRFTLREIIAHLADWEDVFRTRFERTLAEMNPLLSRPDLTERAEEKRYADADPRECLSRFQEGRMDSVRWLRSLPEEAWNRTAHLDRIGDLNLEGLIALMLGHDAYHVRQVSEWLRPPSSNE